MDSKWDCDWEGDGEGKCELEDLIFDMLDVRVPEGGEEGAEWATLVISPRHGLFPGSGCGGPGGKQKICHSQLINVLV